MAARQDTGRREWTSSPVAGAGLFVAAWVLVFVAFAAQLRYTNIVSWSDAFARSAVDRGPWAIVSPAIIALAWFVHSRKLGGFKRVLVHGAGLIVCLFVTEALVQEVFLPSLFSDRHEPPPPAWRPAERWRDAAGPAEGPPPRDFIPDRPPPKPPEPGMEPFARPDPAWRRPPPRAPGGPPRGPPRAAPDDAAPTPPWLAFVGVALRKSYNGVPLYLLIAALSHAFLFWRNLREREGRVSELEERLLVARADMLRLQLEPHFLYNTLNAIGTLVYRDAALADDLIARLSTLLRRLLDLRDEHTISLDKEMETVRAYIGIEQARFGDRLRFEEDIAPDARAYQIPVMLLQPLAENAVRHGIEPLGRPGTLRVAAAMRAGMLDILVEDDGVGMQGKGEKLVADEPSGFGIGLASARVRLAALYGDAAQITSQPRLGGGTRIEIRIPKKLAVSTRRTGK